MVIATTGRKISEKSKKERTKRIYDFVHQMSMEVNKLNL